MYIEAICFNDSLVDNLHVIKIVIKHEMVLMVGNSLVNVKRFVSADWLCGKSKHLHVCGRINLSIVFERGIKPPFAMNSHC